MSIPRSLTLPDGVEATTISTPRGTFAAQVWRGSPDAPHVLLVPGWTGSKEDFTPLLPLLGAAGFSVTAYDQRGQFETPAEATDDFTLTGLAADAGAVARAASPAPSHLLGHSFGGLVAQHAVLGDVDAWRSLSLLCTGPGALGESAARPLGMLVDALGKWPLATIHQYRERGQERPPEIAAFLERRFTGNSPASLTAMTQHLMTAPDRVDDVRATGLPVWVGRGAGDDAWPHAVQAQMAERYGTTIVVVPDAAHSPAIENPPGLIDLWVPFLEAH